jgi:hypothetical protein
MALPVATHEVQPEAACDFLRCLNTQFSKARKRRQHLSAGEYVANTRNPIYRTGGYLKTALIFRLHFAFDFFESLGKPGFSIALRIFFETMHSAFA